jgi:uncharacterized membrane protein YtjA (UPF0391 family)
MILQFLIVCIIVGALLYILSLAPIDATMKMIAKVVIVVAFLIYAIKLLAPFAGL